MFKKNIFVIALSVIMISTSLLPITSGIKIDTKKTGDNSTHINRYADGNITYKEYYPGAKPEPNVTYYNPDQVIIYFKEHLLEVFVGMIFLGNYIVDIIPELNTGLMMVVKYPPDISNIFDLIVYITSCGEVKSAELNTIYYGAPISEGDSTDKEWGQKALNLPKAWSLTKGERYVSIAIVDSGIDRNHPDIPLPEKEIDLIEYWPLWDYEADDEAGHGTITTGIINSVAPNCQIYSVKVMEKKYPPEKNGKTLKFILSKGILHAARSVALGGFGANVICVAITETKEEFQDEDCTLGRACNRARNVYHSIIIAAPLGYESTFIGSPAAYSTTLCVGSINEDYEIYASPHGPEIDLVAPGENIYTTVKDGGYDFKNGTSCATAFVAGIAGLYFSEKKIRIPNMQDVRDCESALVGSASEHDLGEEGKDDYYGWGLVDAYYALTIPYNLVVDFTWFPKEPKVGKIVKFKSSSYDPDGIIVDYHWDFGDGYSISGIFEKKVTHKFDNPGTYEVILNVLSSDGQLEFVSKDLTVKQGRPRLLNKYMVNPLIQKLFPNFY